MFIIKTFSVIIEVDISFYDYLNINIIKFDIFSLISNKTFSIV